MMAQYPDVFIMTFSIHIPNFVLLSQTAQLLLIFCYAAPLLKKQVDVLPSKNQALCDLIYNVVYIMDKSRE